MRALTTNIYRRGNPLDPGDNTPYVKALHAMGENPDTGEPIVGEIHAAIAGEPPPLLCYAEFDTDDGSNWYCRGPLDAHVEPVLRDHFLVGRPGGGELPGWAFDFDGTGSGAGAAQATGVGRGVVRITTRDGASAAAWIEKDIGAVAPLSPDAHQAFIDLGLATVMNRAVNFGWASAGDSLTDAVRCQYNSSSSPVWSMIAGKDGSNSTADSPHAPTAGVAQGFDLLWVPGTFAALWVDGDGPYLVTSNVPTSGDNLTPFVRVISVSTTGSKTVDLDAFFTDALYGTVAHPQQDPLLLALAA